jgi:hypothetical protein
MTIHISRTQTVFLKAVIVLIGIATFVAMLWEPHLEGVNANATTLSEIYLDDPFLAYVYAASTPFFVALYQAFLLLGYIGQNRLFSPHSLRAVRTIKYCALSLIALVLIAEVSIVFSMYGKDDITGGVAMGLFAMVGSAAVAIAAAVFEKTMRKNATTM